MCVFVSLVQNVIYSLKNQLAPILLPPLLLDIESDMIASIASQKNQSGYIL